RMSESLMSRKPLHKRLSRGFATCRSLPPSMGKTCRQKLPGGWPQGCEMPGARSGRWRGRQRPVHATPPEALPVSCHNPSLQVDGMIIGSASGREQGGSGLTLTVHLSLQEFQLVDVPFHRAVAPGQGQCVHHRVHVLLEAPCKTS